MVYLEKIHEGDIWRWHRAVISFILAKQIFLHFYRHGDPFYERYINETEKKYLDDNGTGMKPKHFLQRGMRYTSGCDPRQQFWDRDSKISRDSFGRKIESIDLFIFLGQKSVRLKVIWQWGHVYKMMLLILLLGL